MLAKISIEDLKRFICLEYSKRVMGPTIQQNATSEKRPMYRAQPEYVPDEWRRKFIEDLKKPKESSVKTCTKCKNIVTITEKEHKLVCNGVNRKCYCGYFEGSYKKLFKHIMEMHRDQLLNEDVVPKTASKEKTIKSHLDITKTIRNGSNVLSSIGTTGKFYCDIYFPNRKDEVKFTYDNEIKTCNDGKGNNCLECMKLDIKLRSLPKGHLVNSDGVISKYDRNRKKFYCNRRIDLLKRCGNTVYCGACRQLSSKVNDYKLIDNDYYVLY